MSKLLRLVLFGVSLAISFIVTGSGETNPSQSRGLSPAQVARIHSGILALRAQTKGRREAVDLGSELASGSPAILRQAAKLLWPGSERDWQDPLSSLLPLPAGTRPDTLRRLKVGRLCRLSPIPEASLTKLKVSPEQRLMILRAGSPTTRREVRRVLSASDRATDEQNRSLRALGAAASAGFLEHWWSGDPRARAQCLRALDAGPFSLKEQELFLLAGLLTSDAITVEAALGVALERLRKGRTSSAVVALFGLREAEAERRRVGLEATALVSEAKLEAVKESLRAWLRIDKDAPSRSRLLARLGLIRLKGEPSRGGELLIEALNSGDPDRQELALAEWTRRSQWPLDLGKLDAFLEESAAASRARMMPFLLALIQARKLRSRTVVKSLVAWTGAKEPAHRAVASLLLGRGRHLAGLPALLNGLKDPEASVRINTLAGLAAFDSTQLSGLAGPIAGCLGDRRRPVRMRTARLLLNMSGRSPARVNGLRRALLDADPALTAEVRRDLPHSGSVAVEVVRPLLESPSPGHRSLAIAVLGRTRIPASALALASALDRTGDGLKDPKARVAIELEQLAILEALRDHGAVAESALPALATRFSGPVTQRSAIAILEVFTGIGGHAAGHWPTLVRALGASAPEVQRAGLAALEVVRPADPAARRAVTAALQGLGSQDRARAEALLKTLEKASALGSPGSGSGAKDRKVDPEVAALVEKLGSREDLARFDALSALVERGAAAVPDLLVLLPKQPEAIRLLGIGVLERMGARARAALSWLGRQADGQGKVAARARKAALVILKDLDARPSAGRE